MAQHQSIHSQGYIVYCTVYVYLEQLPLQYCSLKKGKSESIPTVARGRRTILAAAVASTMKARMQFLLQVHLMISFLVT